MGFAERMAHTLAVMQEHLYLRLLPALRDRQQRRALRAGHPLTAPHLVTGAEGENLAYLYLRRLGYTVIARRWTSERAPGDLDIVAYDGPTLVVFEVKTRTARDAYLAEEQVDTAKRGHLRRLTRRLLQEIGNEALDPPPVRFDILSVYLIAGRADIEHYPNAFPVEPESTLGPRRGIVPYAGAY
jgi:putative endonuclease